MTILYIPGPSNSGGEPLKEKVPFSSVSAKPISKFSLADGPGMNASRPTGTR